VSLALALSRGPRSDPRATSPRATGPASALIRRNLRARERGHAAFTWEGVPTSTGAMIERLGRPTGPTRSRYSPSLAVPFGATSTRGAASSCGPILIPMFGTIGFGTTGRAA